MNCHLVLKTFVVSEEEVGGPVVEELDPVVRVPVESEESDRTVFGGLQLLRDRSVLRRLLDDEHPFGLTDFRPFRSIFVVFGGADDAEVGSVSGLEQSPEIVGHVLRRFEFHSFGSHLPWISQS